ncbi:hypothetical protein F5876DRAFT_80920 [Lentinula aff. lateritia]|uniref:Uncharacterized protein n=1 Tax=Lentinula aff. lateritia TaxID=2804960 RepID=A0ACC1TP09_9AGAR|nr:hypothetical protein F5876DRAFT_80920 [Lentinula aff. lateritia]
MTSQPSWSASIPIPRSSAPTSPIRNIESVISIPFVTTSLRPRLQSSGSHTVPDDHRGVVAHGVRGISTSPVRATARPFTKPCMGWHRQKSTAYPENDSGCVEVSALKRSKLDDLLSSHSAKILEQVLNILRNLAEDEDGISIVLNELDIRNPFNFPTSSSPTSSTGFLLLSRLTSILNQTSSPSHSSHSGILSHSPYSSSQDVLIQSASLLANLVNSSDVNHHWTGSHFRPPFSRSATAFEPRIIRAESSHNIDPSCLPSSSTPPVRTRRASAAGTRASSMQRNRFNNRIHYVYLSVSIATAFFKPVCRFVVGLWFLVNLN